ncbi:MAG: putative metal-binding motif-containing protein, partial [Myxococcota bacterium]|nr:putative metal-binding motif-containing protein [Myxococcota bacterium]
MSNSAFGCMAAEEPVACSTEQVMEEFPGVEVACIDCHSMRIHCVLDNCLGPCLGGDESPACIECTEANCNVAFDACADGEPGAGGDPAAPQCHYAVQHEECLWGCDPDAVECLADPCVEAGITCNSPPASFCAEGGVAHHGAEGACQPADNILGFECAYDVESWEPCGEEAPYCAEGECVDWNPCGEEDGEGICWDPPAPFCEGNEIYGYHEMGWCDPWNGGSCDYEWFPMNYCEYGCADGDCLPSPCEGNPCADHQPESYCMEEGFTWAYYPEGSYCQAWEGGEYSCEAWADHKGCNYGCDDAEGCLPDPCEVNEGACQTPPADHCEPTGDGSAAYYVTYDEGSEGWCEAQWGTQEFQCSWEEGNADWDYCPYGCDDALGCTSPCDFVDCSTPPGPQCTEGGLKVALADEGVCKIVDGLLPQCDYEDLNPWGEDAPDDLPWYGVSGDGSYISCYGEGDDVCDALTNTCAGCEGAVCPDPPPDHCIGDAARVFGESYCRGLSVWGPDEDESEIACKSTSKTYFCKWGCQDGACLETNACDEVTCDEPPASFCQEGGVATYQAEGTCSTSATGEPSCHYDLASWTPCLEGDACYQGACVPGETDADEDGVSVAEGDCNDSDGDNFPGNDETCDGKDNNCNGAADEGHQDLDDDGDADCVDGDLDGDGVPNDLDNCPGVPNDEQGDLDENGQGDLCDDDMDGDGVSNA